jgi:aspartyl-tRNA(Asn)/glutamyl-tRNA(Gln) amidotransferase subunit A
MVRPSGGTWRDRFAPPVGVQSEAGGPWSAGDDVRPSPVRRTLNDTFVRFFTRDTLLLTSTLTAPPLSVQVEASAESTGREITRLGWLVFTCPRYLTGDPAATVPCGWTCDRLPVGGHSMPPRRAGGLVWCAAAVCEVMAPWAHQRPSLDSARTSHLER